MDNCSSVGIVIVCYYPKKEKLLQLIKNIGYSNNTVVIANNGGMDDLLIYATQKLGGVVIDMGGNVGLGKAINICANYFYSKNKELLITFDQDSLPDCDYVEKMVNAYNNLKVKDKMLGALSPIFVDSRDLSEYKIGTVKSDSDYPNVLITLQSGLCIPLSVWNKNKFNEYLFIEFVDTEWCFRINYAGYKIYQINDTIIHHEVSESAPINIMSFKLLKYNPVRRYFFFRNVFFLFKQNYIPVYYKIRLLTGCVNRLLSILLLDEDKFVSLRQSLKGIYYGIKTNFKEEVK